MSVELFEKPALPAETSRERIERREERSFPGLLQRPVYYEVERAIRRRPAGHFTVRGSGGFFGSHLVEVHNGSYFRC